MNTKNLLYSFIILTTYSYGVVTLSQEVSPRCTESKAALKVLENKIFDQAINIGDKSVVLRELEKEKASLEAQKAIAETFENIHKQREEFKKRLNPTAPNSFYSKSMNAKTAVQETQKQIISNYILSSITSSISAVLEKDEFLSTSDESVKTSTEWINAKDNIEKFKILSDGNPYEFIKKRCAELYLDGDSNDPCTNFTDIKDKALLTFFSQTNQDMVGDVTNNFFKAFYTSKAKGESISDDALKEIQKDKITDHVSIEGLNKERTLLISSLLEDSGKNGVFDKENLSSFFKVNSINPASKDFSKNPMNKRTTASADKYSVESLKEVEDQFQDAKSCFTKKAFGLDVSCTGAGSISNFFNKINDLGYSPINGEVNSLEQDLLKNQDVKKFDADNLIKGIAQKELNTLAMLGGKALTDSEKYQQMKLVCKELQSFQSPRFTESLWNCIDGLNDKSEKSVAMSQKNSEIDSKLIALNKDLEKAREEVNKRYGDLVKYSAATAKDYCKGPESEYQGSCSGNNSKVTSLVFGTNEKFLTNLDDIEWNLSGKKETEEILSTVSQKCNPILEGLRQKKTADNQITKRSSVSSEPNLKNICSYAKHDLRTLDARTPTEKQKKFRRSYTAKYDVATGGMVYKKRAGIGTMVLKSAGTSLLNNGLPLYLQNAAFKNNLPYQTQLAIQKKNYLHMMNNPQFWSTSMFSGYGVSNPLNGYASSSYYNFGN